MNTPNNLSASSSNHFASIQNAKWMRSWPVYVLLFLVIFTVLDYGYYLTRGTVIESFLIDTLTVRPAATIINTLVPAASATASGHSLLSPFGKINILQGCEGTEGMFLLLAAVLPFPVGWRAKLLGAAGGVLLMYVMNQLRILVLVASLHWHREWFGPFHGLIAPTFIVIAGCLFFFIWANAATAHVHS